MLLASGGEELGKKREGQGNKSKRVHIEDIVSRVIHYVYSASGLTTGEKKAVTSHTAFV